MVDKSKNVLSNLIENFSTKISIKNILIIDQNGMVLVSLEKTTSENMFILDFLKGKGIISKDFESSSVSKNLNQIIFDYMDYKIIFSILKTENYILTLIDSKQDLSSILNKLNKLTEKVEEFFYSKIKSDKYHLKGLNEKIKKLEEYLDIIQPPKFGNIKKLIEYIS